MSGIRMERESGVVGATGACISDKLSILSPPKISYYVLDYVEFTSHHTQRLNGLNGAGIRELIASCGAQPHDIRPFTVTISCAVLVVVNGATLDLLQNFLSPSTSG